MSRPGRPRGEELGHVEVAAPEVAETGRAEPVRNPGLACAIVDLAWLKPQQRMIGGRGENLRLRIPAGGGEELVVQVTPQLFDLIPGDRLDDASQARGHRNVSS